MIRTGLSALLSHWLRHPVQLAMLMLGLALATALWSGVQAINAEARAAYDQAEALLGQDRLDRLTATNGTTIPQATYIQLRRDGWQVSPVVEGRLRVQGLRVLGIEPLTLPRDAAIGGASDLAGLSTDFLAGRSGLALPETIAALGGTQAVNGLTLTAAENLPPMTVLVDIGAAQQLLALDGQISALILSPGPHPAPPPGLALVAKTDTGIARLTDSFHLNLSAFGALAFAVGIFIVHSAIGLAFEQRRPMFRTLRALGLSARTLTLLLVAELLMLALVAGLIGVALGYLVAAALLPDVAATLDGLYGAAVPGSLSLRASWWAAGLAIAVAGTLVAAGQSLWQLLHLPVLAPAQPRAWARASTIARHRAGWAGVALLGLAGGLLAAGTGLWAGFALLACLLIGAALLLPSLLAALIALASRTSRNVVAIWFWADARQQLGGLSLALMALLLALATNIGVGTMVSSFRTAFVGFLDQRLASELYISATTPDQATAIQAFLAPRVTAILPIMSAETDLLGRKAEVFGIADHATYRDNWPLITATAGLWDRIANGTGVLVNEQLSRRAGLTPGDILPLPGGPLPIVGIYSDYGNPLPQAIIGATTFATRFPAVTPLRFALRLPPQDAPTLAADLHRAFDLPETAVVDQAAVKSFSLQIFEQTFKVTAALNLLTLGVASLAIFASLMTLANARLPQLAPVWALGLTLRRLAALEFARTLLLALFTGLAALPLGLALAWVLLAVINVEAFGWRLPLHLFPGDWATLALAALTAAAAAALIPAVRLARRSPSDLLKVFANER